MTDRRPKIHLDVTGGIQKNKECEKGEENTT